ncbi:hypothetical protein Theco_0423 [Thermobacillus composti KWC4]|uniref:GIY-YIG domain-containing protein n=1 Tax=Thermobacillus composti (strain DSM 18247 / JCM 13945 / KWC4) TaxID=717605 RepID=L0EAH1_THECK|nr:GIY-YIG nuclease family protein [Thermobacillus composti]AGA56644.1 hypothetical protein Theco_0423 [Thermobacillus composti KWC4]
MNDRRKELIEQYKQMKPDMGIFRVRLKDGVKCFLETSQNLKGKMNSVRFQLEMGSHPNKELQRDWKEYGPDRFEFEVLELLPYSKDESKIDYSEELEILRHIWEEKLTAEQFEFYRMKI